MTDSREYREIPESVLILGDHRNALTVARQLATHHHLHSVGERGPGRLDRCRHIEADWPLPDALDKHFADRLEALLERLPYSPVLFPVGDNELSGLLRVPSVQKGQVRAVMPAPEIVSVCLDKAALVGLADTLGISQARYRTVSRLSELPRAVQEVGCPCVIKSDHQLSLAFGVKAYRIGNPNQVDALVAHGVEPEHGLIVQAQARGLRHNIYFAADRGRLAGAMEARVLRTSNFDGSGYTVESESVALSDALLRPTEQLVEALGFHGIGNTQFLVDENSGDISFLEISPRLGAAFAVTVPCGFDFAGAGVSLAVGDTPDIRALPDHYPTGRRFAWSFGDLVGLIRAHRRGEISLPQGGKWLWRIARAAMAADIHATWCWQDPRPTVSIFASAFRNTGLKIMHRGSPRLGAA